MDIQALKQRRISSLIREVSKENHILKGKDYDKANNGLSIIYKKFDLAFKAGAELNDFPLDIRNAFFE